MNVPTFKRSNVPTLLVVLFALGLALRLVALLDAPPLSDEVYSIRQANNIARGRELPIVEATSYYGPLLSYLLAGFFWIVGHSILSARFFVAIMGALAPLAVFWLTWVAGGRKVELGAPLVAAALMLTASSHVVVNSHMVWPTSLAALLLAVVLGTYMLGLQEAGGKWLVVAGICAGLLLQSSPHTIAALPGLLAHYLGDSERRERLLRPARNPWPYLGATAFLVVYSPLILYNLLTEGASLRAAAAHAESYAFEVVSGPGEYLLNLRNLLSLFVRVVGNNLSIEVPLFEYYQIGVAALLLGAGMLYCLRRGISAPVWVIASTVALMPVYNKGYYAGFPMQNRYLSFLLPACFCVMALFAFEALLPALSRAASRLWGTLGRLAVLAGFHLALALLVILPVFSALNYYGAVEQSGRRNREVFRRLEQLEQSYPGDAPIPLDPSWENIKVGPGNDLLSTAQVWLELRGREYVIER